MTLAEPVPQEVEAAPEDTAPKKTKEEIWIESAASARVPRWHLDSLYAIYAKSDFPATDKGDAWFRTGDFVKQALDGRNTGYQSDSVKWPWTFGDISEGIWRVEKSTGKLYRRYSVTGTFHANNVYGAKTRLKVYSHMRTDGEYWWAYAFTITDPSKSWDRLTVVSIHSEDTDDFKNLAAPDSLHQKLKAYIKTKKGEGK